MTVVTNLDCFLDMFQGNQDVIALDDIGTGHPGPLHVSGEGREGAWRNALIQHLQGTMGIGVYPYNHEHGAVRWGCVDLDDGEETGWDQAMLLRDVLRACGIESWIERSRSKGWHVWLFTVDWTPATWMRRALIGACQTAHVPHREVNPKSETLDPVQLGNFVRLPYKDGLLRTPQRQVMVDLNRVPFPLYLFVELAVGTAAKPHEILAVADQLYVEPAIPRLEPRQEVEVTDSYLRGAIERAAGKICLAAEGERNITLNHETFSLARLVRTDDDALAIHDAMLAAGVAAGLSARECEGTIRSAFKGRERDDAS
jgi:hypothetical protein